jgi:hypothetical protein
MRLKLLIETLEELPSLAGRACRRFGFARQLDKISAKPRKKLFAHG